MAVDSVDNIVISPDSVRQKAEEVEELEQKAAKARKELDLLFSYLRFIGRDEWIPPPNMIVMDAETHRRSGAPRFAPGTWTGEVIHILQRSPNGISLLGIRDELAKGDLAQKLRMNPNGFYNAVSRLESSGEVVRHKGMVFSAEHLQSFKERVARGEIEDLSGEERPRTLGVTVLEYIAQFPNGVPAKQVVADMVALGHAPTEASVYNILSKLARAERVNRDNGVYFPRNETGHPQNTEGSPEAGGAGTPPETN